MLRPEDFQQPHVTVQNLPYVYADGSAKEAPSAGGVLGRGQVVWTQNAFAEPHHPHLALAFVEEVGLISLDARWLTRADLAKGD